MPASASIGLSTVSPAGMIVATSGMRSPFTSAVNSTL